MPDLNQVDWNHGIMNRSQGIVSHAPMIMNMIVVPTDVIKNLSVDIIRRIRVIYV